MIERKNTNKSVSTQIYDLSEHDTLYQPYQEGFRFAIALTDYTGAAITIDETYFNLRILQSYYDTSSGVVVTGKSFNS